MKLSFFVIGAICLIGGIGIGAQAQDGTAESATEAWMPVTQRSFTEVALDMILQQNQGRFLDEFVDPGAYLVGPGDRFRIGFTDGDLGDIFCEVSADGNLFIKSVGSVELGHVTLGEALARITETVERNYSGTAFSVGLENFRFCKINVVGEVARPGMYYAPATWRVSEVVALAGGLTGEASRRHIQLRGPRAEIMVDLLRFNVTGELLANPMVCWGYAIKVPAQTESDEVVTVSGLVRRPGIVELAYGDRVSDLLRYAGGVDGNLESMQCHITPSHAGEAVVGDANAAQILSYVPSAGDNITLTLKDGHFRRASVTVLGAVKRPGRYDITANEYSLADLMNACNGPADDAAMSMLQIYRLLSVVSGAPRTAMAAIAAQPAGSGGGERSERFLVSNNPRHPFAPERIMLTEGDSIYVPVRSGMVAVTGAVASPGLIPRADGRGVDYYLEQAGGLGFDADRHRMTVINPVTGAGIAADAAGQLFDGEILFVPKKESQTKP